MCDLELLLEQEFNTEYILFLRYYRVFLKSNYNVLPDHFLNQFEPSVQSKLKMITAAHQNAKKYLDITVTALKNQKQ